MRHRIRVSLFTAIVLGCLSPVLAQTSASEIPRTAEGRPELDGIWQALSEANWDIRPHGAGHALLPELGTFSAIHPGLGVIEGEQLPYQEWAYLRQQENFVNRLDLDPEGKCFLPGVPRATYLPYPFQILQTSDLIMIAYQYANAVRTIHMNDPGPSPANSWMGWSVGYWEGDTLVVDVSGMNDQTWFDRAGNFHSDALHVIEHYTPAGQNHLLYEATIEDPNVFRRPWKISLPLYRRIEQNVELMEFKCVELVEEKVYGDLRKEPF